jgi:hypothetical protein
MKYVFMALIAITAFSCHKNKEPQAAIQDVQLNELEKKIDTTKKATPDNYSPGILQSGSPDWDKKIIRTANLSLELKEYHRFNTAIHQSLRNYGAYIAQEQQLQSEGQIRNEVSIKVPVDQFENALNYLSGIDKEAKVLDKQVTSEDVSTEVVDTKSRIETKKQLRAKYFELMGQAKKMEDVLHVQNEINSITEDIEAAASRVEYLSHQSAFSTINLNYYQVLDAAKIDDASPSFFTSFVNAFKQGGSIITNVFLFFVNIWPVVIGGVAAWYVIRRRTLKAKPQPQQLS